MSASGSEVCAGCKRAGPFRPRVHPGTGQPAARPHAWAIGIGSHPGSDCGSWVKDAAVGRLGT